MNQHTANDLKMLGDLCVETAAQVEWPTANDHEMTASTKWPTANDHEMIASTKWLTANDLVMLGRLGVPIEPTTFVIPRGYQMYEPFRRLCHGDKLKLNWADQQPCARCQDQNLCQPCTIDRVRTLVRCTYDHTTNLVRNIVVAPNVQPQVPSLNFWPAISVSGDRALIQALFEFEHEYDRWELSYWAGPTKPTCFLSERKFFKFKNGLRVCDQLRHRGLHVVLVDKSNMGPPPKHETNRRHETFLLHTTKEQVLDDLFVAAVANFWTE